MLVGNGAAGWAHSLSLRPQPTKGDSDDDDDDADDDADDGCGRD